MKSKLLTLLYLAQVATAAFAGTVITNNLPPNTAIVNIDARQDGAANYNGDQSLWYKPFYTGSATQLLSYVIQPGTYSFRVINPADAAQLFPTLTAAQTNQMFSAWTYNSPWIEDYLVFPGVAATDTSVPQIFDGAPDVAYASPTAAYNGAIATGAYQVIRTGPTGRDSTVLTNSYTFDTATNLIFAVPDYGLSDNGGGVSIVIAPTTPTPLPTVKTWTGAADQNWFNGNNWSPTGVPQTNDTISINTGSTINLTSPVTVAGKLNWYNGAFQGQPLTIATNGVVNLLSGNSKTVQMVVTNAGQVHWFDGDVAVQNYSGGPSGTIENLAGAVWDIECDRTFYNPYGNALAQFHNLGTLQKSTATGNTVIRLALANESVITAQSGTISFDDGGTIQSIFNASAGAAIRFDSGTFNYSSVPTLNGPGNIQFSGGGLTLVDDIIPNLQMVGGTIALSPTFQGGVITNLNLNGANLAGSYVVAGTLTCANGVSGALTVTNNGTLNWTGGTITGLLDVYPSATVNWTNGTASSTINIRPSAFLNLMTGNTKVMNSIITNAGTVTWFDGDLGVYNYNGGPNGAVENLAGAVWDIRCDRTIYNPYGNTLGYFHNLGTLQKTAGTGTSYIRLYLNNAGTVTAQTGNMYFQSGGIIESVFNASAGASIHFDNGSFTYNTVPTLNGPGAIQFTGGGLTLLDDIVPNLQLIGGSLTLSTNFQMGGVITNLNIGGALSGNYTNAGNLTIGNGSSGTITILNGATFTWNGGSVGGLALNNGATVNWNNGTLSGALDIVPGAIVNWASGTANNIINVETNAALNFISSNSRNFTTVLTNAGTVTWSDGDIGVYNYNGGPTGAIENLAGGVWDIRCDRTLYNPYGNSSAYFHNLGTLQKSAGTGNTYIRLYLNNAGTVTAQTGTILFQGGGIINSIFNAASGASIRFNSGTFSYTTVPTLNGPGAIVFDGGGLTLNDDIIPNMQYTGGTIALGTNFQGGTITNLVLNGANLSGSYVVTGTLTSGNGVSGSLIITNGGTLNWTGGTITGLLEIGSGAVVNWTNGTASSTINIQPNGALNLLTSNTKLIQNVMTNAGTVTWYDGDFGIYNYNGGPTGAIENLPTGLWDIRCDRTMYNPYGNTLDYFRNQGTLMKSAGTGITYIRAALINSGTVTAQTGTIRFQSGGKVESVFNAVAGAAIQFDNGDFSYSSVPTLNGPGAIQLTGGDITLLSDVIPNLQMIGGSVILSPAFQGGTITNLVLNGATLSGDHIVTGTFTCGGGVSGGLIATNGALVNWTGGNITGPLDIAAGALVNWSTGIETSTLNVRTNGALNLLTSNTKGLQSAFTNAGTVTWLDGDFAVYNYSGGFTGGIENMPGALWDIECDRTIYNPYGNLLAYFHNWGTTQKSVGTGQTAINISFNNAGTLDTETGQIYFNNNNYAQTGATLRFGLSSSGVTQLRLNGNMAFDGTLSGGFVRGYLPRLGDVFTFITYNSHSSTFGHFNLPTLNNGLSWQVSYNSGSAQLQIVTNANTTAHITGVVTNSQGTAVANVTVYAYTTNSSASGYVSSTTDSSGQYSLAVSNATWNVGLQNLPAFGYDPVAEQTVTIADADATANFSLQTYSGQLYSITTSANPAQAGTTSGDGVFAPGSVVTVSAVANTSSLPYSFTNWTENGVFQSANSTYSFLASRDRQLTANFTLPLYTITVSNNPSTAGVVVGPRSNYYGETNILTAQPNFGYSFSNWTENGTVLSTSLTLSNVIYANHTFVANYAEANLSHDVSFITSPLGIATISGAGTFTNHQTGTFTAPPVVITSTNIYTFQKFTLSNNLVTTSTNFSKTFATTDATNLQYVAVYTSMSVTPQIVSATANHGNPVPAMTNLLLTFRFDRSMDTNFTPTVLVTNAAPGAAQPQVTGTGTWSTTSQANDTYVTPKITLATGMDGTNNVFISDARDLYGDILPQTNQLTLVIDATFPAISSITVTPGTQSAYVTWVTDESASSQADYGTNTPYNSSTPFFGQLVQQHAVTLTGLDPLTTYHFRVRSRDQAGNETFSDDQTVTTLSAPDLQVQNLTATGAFNSGSNIVIAWDDANTGAGATYSSWYDLVTISNTTTSQMLLNTSLWYDANANGNITNGASQHRQTTFRLPDGVAGTGNLQITVTANVYHSQFENTYNNNSATISKTSALSAYPDLQVAGLAVTNAVVQSGSVLGLQWQDTNSGNGPITGNFYDSVVVSNSDTAQVLANTTVFYNANSLGTIAPGQAVDRQYSFTLPNGTSGAGHLVVTVNADSGNNIFENNGDASAETNNSSSIMAVSSIAAYADLAPTNIVVPSTANAGQTIQVSWTDLNLGSATAVGPWSDQVFISDTPTLGTGQAIGTFQVNNVIAANNSLSITQSVTLPPYVSGNQWLIVKANAANNFFENNTANNSIVAVQPINVGATLSLTLDRPTISESAGNNAVTATITRNGDTTAPLSITLTNLGLTNVVMPGNLAIAVGQHSAIFKIGLVDQHIAGGSGSETITAAASGFPTASATMHILYDDVAVLTVTINTNQVREDAAPGEAFATVTRNANFGAPLTVTLISDLTSAMTVPATVTIPAGQPSAVVNLTPVNDNTVGDTRTVHILASATGFGTASAPIDVLNVNAVQLSLALADSSVAKGAPSPATIGTVTRTPVLSADQNIYIAVTGSSLVSVPSIVTIPAGQASATFNINVGDDNLSTGSQVATISAEVLTPSHLISAIGGTSIPLTVLDTHGPTLSVSFADSVIAKGANTTGTVTRNTPATNALVVNLTASPSDAVTVPATVTIPQGQSSVTFNLSGVLDNTQTGARKVAVNAAASTFNSGVGNVTVSDIYYADLAPTTINVPASALTEQQITVSWVITNKGLSAATNQWLDYVYLSSDQLGQKANLAAFKQNPTSLAVGASYTNQASFYLPNVPGTYWIEVASDGGNVVTELNKQNNTLVSSANFSADPTYRAMLTSATPQLAPSGTPIVLTGYTYNPQDNSRVVSKAATVRVLINGTRRVYSVTSDANGDFSYTFQPLANEAGDYAAGADYPQVPTDASQVSFALLGMQALPGTINTQIIPNTPVTNYLVLTNLTGHALTGLQITVPDLQGHLTAQFTLTNTSLPGNDTLTVPYVLSSALTQVAQIKFGAHVTSDQGAQLTIPANVTVVPLTPQLSANPGYLTQGMLVGSQTLVSFDVINTGGKESGDLTVTLPSNFSWMSLSSPAIIPSLAPGAKATVTLALNPPSDLPLTLYQGSLAVANNSTAVSVSFQFRATSDGKGDLRVTATDDYTYYVAGAPKVTNATVTLRDAITMAAVAQTNTDVNGIAYFAGLPEGPYVVDSSAPQHNPFRGAATIVNGTTNDVEAFMTRQLVTYQWTVVPTEVQDEYKIQLESVFETEVPVPNVVIEEPQVMMFVAPGHVTQFDLKMRNEGLIAAQGVTVLPPNDPNYLITPLVQNVGTIPAQSEVSVPVTIQLRSDLTATNAFRPKELGPECGVQPSPCLPKIALNVQYYYPCGGNNVVQDRSVQMALLCTGKDLADKIIDCLKNLHELTGSENLASVGCNALSAFLSCVGPDLDPCTIAALNTACGAATGGLAGAAGGAAGSLPACICAHLQNLPLPSFPTANQAYDGRPDFGLLPILPTGSYYVSGSPVVTAVSFGSCSDSGPSISSSLGTTKTAVVGSMLAPKLPAPKTTTQGVCARVRIRIDQDVVLTRTAFKGTLEVDNGGDHNIDNIRVDLDFRDSTNGVAADKFLTEGPVVSTLTAVDGSGTLAGGASGSAVWTFIPTVDAAPDAPETFQIGGTLSYTDNGEQVTVPLLSAPITVYPEARLDLNYFQQRDVYADDPFTSQIEPSEPFALGLIVKNVGAGNAHNFKITSGQPQIVDNEKGLLINFSIIGTEVGDQPLTPSLSATLGDISPGGAKQVVWDMVSTLQGRFISFDASFQHVNDLGATNTSLINSVQIHELTHKVLANRILPFDSASLVIDDDLPDFLVNDVPDPDNLPDTLYVSDGSTAPVTVFTNATVDAPAGAGHLQVHVSFTASNGWNYVQLPDPGVGFLLASVVRSDGKPIALTNDAWTTDRTFPASTTGAVRENLLHLFDWIAADGNVSYTVTYRSTNTTPPAIVQFGPVTPFVQPGAVSSVNVTFSEQIDLNTFDYRSLVLTRNGGANLIGVGSGVTVTQVSGTNYSINGLSGLTTFDGNYELTINGALINDVWGNSAGNVSASVEWTKGNAPVVVQSIDSISPNPRKTPVGALNVTFSRAINASTFDYRALTLTLNGGPNRITPDVTISANSGSSFTINGLAAVTGDEGAYVLTVNAAAIQDANNSAGAGAKSVGWTNLLTGPRIVGLQQLTANPRNIVVQSLDVTFAQSIDARTFDYRAVTLTRDGGPNLITSDVTITPINSTTYRVGNINWVQGYAGTYSFSVSAAGISDLAGNAGSGSTNETWQIILEMPPSPTNIVITPDTGASSTDGLTATNSILLSGTVGTTNLTVRAADLTSGLDLGVATVNGTNFTLPLTFTAEGQHHLKLYSVDVAQNVSSPTFFDTFIDLVAPSAVIQDVTPSPITTPVTNLLITFSEPINTNTLSAVVAAVTRDGNNVGTPTIVSTSSSTALVTGLAGATGTPGSYQVTVNLNGVQDLAGNLSQATLFTGWQNVPANQPPVITQVSDATVQPGNLFQQQIQASDPEGNNFTLSLANGAPLGAALDTNGVFTWTPTCDQGGTTNVITINATDDGSPIASSSMSFTIAVSDCVQIQVGSAIAQVGKTGTLPVTVFSSTGVTNLSFVLSYPSNRLGNWTIAASNSAVANAAASVLDPARTMFQVSAASGQSLQGSALLGTLSFTPLSGPSAFLPLNFANASATKSGNSSISSVLSTAGRVAVIGAEPLLETTVTESTNAHLVLYGNPGASYQVAMTTNLGATWLPAWRVPMTNLYQTFDVNWWVPQAFYRAWEFSADPPLLDVTASGANAMLVLYGRNGTNYVVESATTLSNPVWSTIANLQLTNSFSLTNVGAITNSEMYFRARRP